MRTQRVCPEWRYDKDHLGRYSPLQISEHGGLAKAHAAGGAQSGTAILAVTVTDHRLEACATFPHRNTATAKRSKVPLI